MILLLVGAWAFALLAFPAAAQRWAQDIAPARWARIVATSLVSGLVLVEVSLLLLAAPTILAGLGADAFAAACGRLLGNLAPGGPGVGWLAFAVAVLVPAFAAVGVGRTLRTQRVMVVEAGVGVHECRADFALVTLPADDVFAFAVHGPTPQVVVSSELRSALEPAQFDAVIRHEAAHLRHGHARYLLIAAAIEHTFGVVSPMAGGARVLRLALERWADEDSAAATVDGRKTLRLALVNVALLVLGPAVPAFSGGDVLARVEAMERTPSAPRPFALVAFGVPTVLLAFAGLALTRWAGEARMMLSMAGFCPI